MATIKSIGKYQVLGTLGKGAHSTIMHIRRAEDSREYALKIVPIDGKEDLKFLEQAKHEFRVAGMLAHPNLIRIWCLELRKSWLFQIRRVEMLIELVQGKTLDETPPMPMKKLVPVFARVAAGLVHMHRRGVFHGDLKPGNILYGKRGDVKIIDFGLATIKGEDKDRVQGTPEYIAPETARAKMINERTDIFNFGATLYRMATLKLPPSAMAAGPGIPMNEKTWKSLLTSPREINRTIPAKLDELILSCLGFRLENRPERMTEIQEVLENLAEELGEPVEDGKSPGE